MSSDLSQWLVDVGGPTIRCRAVTELQDDASPDDVARAARDLAEGAMVQRWLHELRPGVLHHSADHAFENVANRLADLGMRAGMAALDRTMVPVRQWLTEMLAAEPDWTSLYGAIAAATMARLGYLDDGLLTGFLPKRLDRLARFVEQGRYDIYVDKAAYTDIPKAFQKRQLVDPALYDRSGSDLPSIWDMYMLANCPAALCTNSISSQIDAVVEYVLDPRYQALEEGYGILRAGPRRYYSMGWSVHLAGYGGLDALGSDRCRLVQRVLLMARFPAARRHRWFGEAVAHLESFRRPDGRYHFPGGYLEERTGYWVAGAHMALEENRRRQVSRELEATFYMLALRSLTDGRQSAPHAEGMR